MRDFRHQLPQPERPGRQIALDFRDTVPPAGIPTTLVIDADGRIAARVIGEVTYNGLQEPDPASGWPGAPDDRSRARLGW